MMYSIIPDEVIFSQPDDVQIQQKFARIEGVPVLVCSQPAGGYRVERVLSTNPQDYLKGNLLGRKINSMEFFYQKEK